MKASRRLHRLDVDHSEDRAALLDVVRRGGAFDVQMVRLPAGDYLIDDEVLIERKTIADFATSLADGRLFPQAARLAHSPHRSILLIEGPTPASVPAIHPQALEGALVSLAAMWRLPVIHSIDPEHSARILQLLANQASKPRQHRLRRFDRKPKRLASRRLFVLQGLPGVGPALAHRLLTQLGSVEGVITASVAELTQTRGLGPKKAARIRELVAQWDWRTIPETASTRVPDTTSLETVSEGRRVECHFECHCSGKIRKRTRMDEKG